MCLQQRNMLTFTTSVGPADMARICEDLSVSIHGLDRSSDDRTLDLITPSRARIPSTFALLYRVDLSQNLIYLNDECQFV